MLVGSLFSGIGGFDLGLERAGMRVVFQCESDAWCRGILAQHWPDVPCFDDVRAVRVGEPASRSAADSVCEAAHDGRREAGTGLPDSVDLLCGGFPCQDLSVAGRRAGLAGERSGLFFEFARVADELVRSGGWVLVENVPGLLSSARGRDFAVVVRTLGDIGFHDLAWRVLDSRYFGVPQRRRRVFIVGRRAVGRGAREVLLEPESGRGDFAPSREARAEAALLAEGGAVQSLDRAQGGADDNSIAHTLRAEGFDASEDGTGRGMPRTVGTVRSHMRPGSNSFDLTIAGPIAGGNDGAGRRTQDDPNLVGTATDAHGVRTATGLPRRVDDPRPDGPRYNACGNAVTVPVIEWLGWRIMSWEAH